ncbi:MAG: deoxyribose-phosphate aldolase [Chlorobi bacterium]|nr:deoxyribose-phosphate aldolase [Chlorobiota bacterium]
MDKKLLAKMIDNSMLQPTFTDEEIIEKCKIADKYKVATVCVRPCDVKTATYILKNSSVQVSTVIGFPHGTTSTHTKLEESKEAIANGAVELDVVLNIGKMKSGDYVFVENELSLITDYAQSKNVKIKIIFENCYLTENEIIKACEICSNIKVNWVKTSTGFGTYGATEKDVQIMINNVSNGVEVKASGGISSLEKALKMVELGCTRFGASDLDSILGE